MRFVDWVVLSDQRAMITPRDSGQVLRFGGEEFVCVAGVPVEVVGSGLVELSSGFWAMPGVFPAGYLGGWVAGSSDLAVVGGACGARASGAVYSGDATHLVITAPVGTGQYRLTEGTHTGFRTGDGVPKVLVKDPDRTLQMISDAGALSDYQITLEEIG